MSTIPNQRILDSFLSNLELQTKHKAKLYDGIDRNMPIDTAIRLIVEEFGEISQEVSRNRLQSALDECIDLAHCVFLLYKAIIECKEVERSVLHLRSNDVKEQ